jgi:para-nitrobenzyl esterase
LGFLAHAAFARENPAGATGNYGLFDQVAALQWVQRNVGAFGGDRSRVLLFGQSAGAYSTCNLVASPRAGGLFSRAAMHSGNCSVVAREKAEAWAEAFAAAVGCSDAASVAACLRGKTGSQLAGAKAPRYVQEGAFSWGPTVDGDLLPVAPHILFATGKHNHVPLLMGVTMHEFSTLWGSVFASVPLPRSKAEYAAVTAQIFGSAHVSDLLTHYPLSDYASPAHAIITMASDIWFVCPNRAYARLIAGHQEEPVRRFLFAHVFDVGPMRPYGAGHGHDVYFLFHIPPLPWWLPTPRERELSQTLTGYWMRFAKTGDPNGKGALAWPPYDPALDSYMTFDTELITRTGLRREQCDFIDSVQ